MTRSVVQVHISPPLTSREKYGAIAQLIRAPPLQGGGPGFESLLLHHIMKFAVGEFFVGFKNVFLEEAFNAMGKSF